MEIQEAEILVSDLLVTIVNTTKGDVAMQLRIQQTISISSTTTTERMESKIVCGLITTPPPRMKIARVQVETTEEEEVFNTLLKANKTGGDVAKQVFFIVDLGEGGKYSVQM